MHLLLRNKCISTGIRLFSNITGSASSIAALLDEKFPNRDPSRITVEALDKVVYSELVMRVERSQLESVLAEWRRMYEKRLHDAAYEDMADPGELNDGELPSWRDARLRVEADPSVVVPDVSAREAANKIKKNE